MKILVERFIHAKDWTISKVYLDGALICYAVEDEYRKEKVHGETRIPDGIYPLGYRQSPKFSKEYLVTPEYNLIQASKATEQQKKTLKTHELIWIKDVPGFNFILLHWGNTDDDTEGCLIIGNKIGVVKGQEGVLESRVCYTKWYPTIFKKLLIEGGTIEYKSINFKQ